MHTFVINLEKDNVRREFISRQLNDQGITYEIISGVYGASLDKNERARLYDDRKAKLNCSRSLVSAEIGCSLSHLKVYRRIIEQKINVSLILEDDVLLPENFKRILNDCLKKFDRPVPTILLLSPGVGDVNSNRIISINGDYKALPYRSGYYTSSYMINLAAARFLLEELEPVSDVADCWLRLSSYKVADIFVIAPPLVMQQQDVFGSSTTTEKFVQRNTDLISVFFYRLYRVRSILWGFIYARYRSWFRARY